MKRHESQRGYFAFELYEQMKENPKLVVITGDLGYGMLNAIRDEFPDRFFNVGAAEQAMIGVAVGMAYAGKIPIVYSITNFLLFRPFEWLRNYVDKEKLHIILAGGGRDKDYLHDGFTHWSPDAKKVLECLPNIKQLWPETLEEAAIALDQGIEEDGPLFISLTR